MISGSSDGTIKLWSLGQQQCISTYKIHEGGVWALLVNEAFTTMYSAGRDRRVWATDIRNQDCKNLICEEKAPILKVGTNNIIKKYHTIILLVNEVCREVPVDLHCTFVTWIGKIGQF